MNNILTKYNQRRSMEKRWIFREQNKIEDPIDYINAIIGKKKTIEDTEETEPINLFINIDGQEIEWKVAYILA